MKITLKILPYLIIALFVFNACEKDVPVTEPEQNFPISNFSYTASSQYPPAEIQFANASAFSTNYSWDFGDGSTSTEINPTHSYLTSGNYTVNLKSMDDDGNSKTSSQLITVSEPPTKLFLKSLVVSNIPFLNNVNQLWDPLDGPDVYVSFQGLNYIEFAQTDVIDNIESGELPVSWTWEEPYLEMSNVGYNFFIVFIEYDGYNIYSAMEGPITFSFSALNGYPETVQMSSPNGNFVFEMELIWE